MLKKEKKRNTFCSYFLLIHNWLTILVIFFMITLKVLLNMLEYGMDPQEALDAPRFCIIPSHNTHDNLERGVVAIEDGIPMETISKLKALGHRIQGPIAGYDRALFGRGQIIRSKAGGGDRERVWWAGSDGRADGIAVGYWVFFWTNNRIIMTKRLACMACSGISILSQVSFRFLWYCL